MFLLFLFIADMAIYMSNYDNFDIDQMFSKFAQRWLFVFKKNSILGSLDRAENAKIAKGTFF